MTDNKYNFDQIIDRKGTDSLKYDFAVERGMAEGLTPMWVADMDFAVPPEVTQALIESVNHGVFGYTETKTAYFEALAAWWNKRFGYLLREEWLVKTCGVVFALAAAVRAYTEEGQAVLIQNPVYYPFTSVVKVNRRKLVVNSLVVKNGRYEIDFEDFERKIVQEKVKLFLLCSPHNPVSRVWEKWELQKIADICFRHGVKVVADEIHCDFVFGAARHTVFASLSEEVEKITITCTAPSKTFNLAGLQVSNIFIADKELRELFLGAVRCTGYSQLNTLGLVACRAAYTYGEPWLESLKKYLLGNIDYVRKEIARRLGDKVYIHPNEGTYLMWLDFAGTGLELAEIKRRVVDDAGLWLDSGEMFGPEGMGFQRVNIAAPRSVIENATDRLINAFGG